MSFRIGGQDRLYQAAELNALDPPTTSKAATEAAVNQADIELSEMTTSQEPHPLTTEDTKAKNRLESSLSPLERMAPGLDLTQVTLGKEAKRSKGGASGAFFIKVNDVNIVIKPPDQITPNIRHAFVATKVLELLGVKVPHTELVNDPKAIKELNRISQREANDFLVMERVQGTSFDVLSEDEEERLFSADKDYFDQLGRMVLFDHLFSDQPDRFRVDKSNEQNIMLTEDHVVAIDNGVDLLGNNGPSTKGLEDFKNIFSANKQWPRGTNRQ